MAVSMRATKRGDHGISPTRSEEDQSERPSVAVSSAPMALCSHGQQKLVGWDCRREGGGGGKQRTGRLVCARKRREGHESPLSVVPPAIVPGSEAGLVTSDLIYRPAQLPCSPAPVQHTHSYHSATSWRCSGVAHLRQPACSGLLFPPCHRESGPGQCHTPSESMLFGAVGLVLALSSAPLDWSCPLRRLDCCDKQAYYTMSQCWHAWPCGGSCNPKPCWAHGPYHHDHDGGGFIVIPALSGNIMIIMTSKTLTDSDSAGRVLV